jgi:hypothetical protein
MESTISTAGAADADVARIVSRFVSLRMETAAAESTSRSERSLIWSGDSSADE